MNSVYMPKTFKNIWVKFANGKATKARVPIDGDIDDLCKNLKDVVFKNKFLLVDRDYINVMSSDGESYGPCKKIMDLHTTTSDHPFIVTLTQEICSSAPGLQNIPERHFIEGAEIRSIGTQNQYYGRVTRNMHFKSLIVAFKHIHN